jgi:hypothetical protein
MKKIDESAISGTVGMPIKSGVLSFLQDAYRDMGEMLMGVYSAANLYPDTANYPYILRGVYQTVSGSSYSSTAGFIRYNGELFYVPATSFTFGATPVLCINIANNNIAANADPVLFTDGNSRNVLQTRIMQVVDGSSATAGYVAAIASVYILPEQNCMYDFSQISTPYTTSTVFSTITANTYHPHTNIIVTAVFDSNDSTHVHSLQILKNGTLITQGATTAYVTCSANGATMVQAQTVTTVYRGDVITCKINPHSGSTVNIDSYTVSVIQTGLNQ